MEEQFIQAARDNNVSELRRLIAAGVDKNAAERDGDTALLNAVWKKSEAAVDYLLSIQVDVNKCGSNGWSPLHRACNQGYTSIAEKLIRQGADINRRYNNPAHSCHNKTPLEWLGSSTERQRLQAIADSLKPSAAPAPVTPPTTTPPSALAPAPAPAPAQATSFSSMWSIFNGNSATKNAPTPAPVSPPPPPHQPPAQPSSSSSSVSSSTATSTTLQAELDELRRQLLSAQTERGTFRNERNQFKQQLESSEQANAKLTNERNLFAEQLESSHQANAKLIEEKAKLATDNGRLRADYAALRSDYERLLASQVAVPTDNSNQLPFQQFRPHRLIDGILPLNARPGLHTVSTASPLHRYCNAICEHGGSWRDGASPVAGFRLVAVQAVLHDEDYYGGYASRQIRLLKLRENGGEFFNFATRDKLNLEQLLVLSTLRDQFQERAPGSNRKAVNTFYCFHGPRPEHVESICCSGMVATGAMDSGYFGRGIYSTLNIEYAARYARGEFDDPEKPARPEPADGRYPVIMFATSVSMAYPITREADYGNVRLPSDPPGCSDYYGRPMKAGFDCHVVCVNQSNGFQAVNRDMCQYVEVVIDQESQMLPIAVLWFER